MQPYKLYNMSASIFDLNDTRCFNVVLNTTEALSPAFIIEGNSNIINYNFFFLLYLLKIVIIFLQITIGHQQNTARGRNQDGMI